MQVFLQVLGSDRCHGNKSGCESLDSHQSEIELLLPQNLMKHTGRPDPYQWGPEITRELYPLYHRQPNPIFFIKLSKCFQSNPLSCLTIYIHIKTINVNTLFILDNIGQQHAFCHAKDQPHTHNEEILSWGLICNHCVCTKRGLKFAYSSFHTTFRIYKEQTSNLYAN